MMHHMPEPAHRPRLNPFVFPSDTSLRFILLLLSVLGATLWIYNSQLLSTTSDSVNYIEAKFRCTTESGVNTATKEALSAELQTLNRLDAAQNAYQQCMTPFYVQDAIRMGVGV